MIAATTNVLLVGGSTGGHLYPGLALAGALRRLGVTPHFVCRERELEQEILSSEESVFPIREGGWKGIASMRAVLDQLAPRAIIGLGGGDTVLPATLATLRRCPLFLLEQNRVLGRANRLLLRVARRVFLSFDDTAGPERALRQRALRVGCPVRETFVATPLPSGVPRVLVLGGSQGAQALNELVRDALPSLAELSGRVEFEHLAGRGKSDGLREAYRTAGITAHVHEYVVDPATLFASASLVVARSGGSTVAEVAAVGRGALFLPYPHHRDRQQFLNAEALERVGAAQPLDGDPSRFAAQLEECVTDPSTLQRMAERAAAAGRPQAARHIAETIATHIECAPRGVASRELAGKGNE